MLLFILFLLLSFSLATSLKMLHLTDIHYNPLFNPIYSNNWCLPPNLQKTYYNTQSNYYGMEGCNPPITLIDAFLENAKENGPYNVIIVSGDICSHSLPNALHAECLQLVMEKIKMNFGETPIVYSMGNNDTPTPKDITCSDQQFAVLYNHFNDYIPSNQEKVFKQLASYSVTIEDQLFISINTNLINKYHPNDCQLLSWLQGELELAEQNNQRAIIVGHTPPGVSTYDGKNNYYESHQTTLFDILTTYTTNINSMIFGHIHTDQFRILPQQQPQCILIGNSLSPVYGNTVGYRIYYTISNKYKGFLDYIQYNFDLSNSNLQKHPIWFPSYSFTSKFNVFDVSINSFLNIFSNVHFDSSSLVNSKTNGFSHGDDPMFWCSITSPTNTEFMKCIDDCNEE